MTTEPETPPSPQDPDQDLLDAVRRGDGAAFESLVRRHEARIHRLAHRILGDAEDALDAAQETFVKAWRALAGFEGEARFSTWLTRIAINQCRNELRRRRTVKHTHPLSLDAPAGDDLAPLSESVPSAEASPFERAREREVAAALRVALGDLDGEGKEVLLLRDGENLSYEDVALVLDVPVGTVRSRLHRARSELRRRMAPVLEDPASPKR